MRATAPKSVLTLLLPLALRHGVMAYSETMWYAQPAEDMHDATPIGNGRLGALVYGGVGQEKLTLNEDSLYSGGFRNRVNNRSIEALATVRQLMDDGDFLGADEAYIEGLAGTPNGQRTYQTAGSILVSTGHSLDAASGYNRSLDLSTSVASTAYTVDGVNFFREAVANHPTGVLAFRFWASEPASVSVNVTLGRDQGVIAQTADADSDTLILEGRGTADDDDGYTFTSGARVVAVGGGSVGVIGDDTLSVTGADSVEVFWDAETLFHYPDATHSDEVARKLDAASEAGFADLKAEAVEDFRSIYTRASLSLPETDQSQSRLPTADRLVGINSTGTFDEDPTLLELSYNFGRYLLISSSRPGSLPANLQGIWNEGFWPAWDSKYTININIEMHYWQTEMNNMPEVAQPLWTHLGSMQQRGADVAREMYDCAGWVCHHNTDLWGDCAPQDAITAATAWPMGAVWLTNQAMDHFRFTQDLDFAAGTALPLAASALEFIYDFAVLDGNYSVIYPASSPELSYLSPGQDGSTGLSVDAQMNKALLHDLAGSFIELSEATGSTDGVEEARSFLATVGPPTVSSETGRLLEWGEDFVETEPGHRHFSSIYGLYPGRQYSPLVGDQDAYQGAINLLDYRMSEGSGSTGWSRVWAGLLRDRAFDGDAALDDAHHLLVSYTSPNLFSDAHGVVQMDATFGVVSLINEMFLQSSNGVVHIGPSIPSSAVATGSFEGWVARGSFVVDAAWENGDVVSASITSRSGKDLAIRIQDGRSFEVDGQAYDGPFSTEAGATYKITF